MSVVVVWEAERVKENPAERVGSSEVHVWILPDVTGRVFLHLWDDTIVALPLAEISPF